MFDAKQILFKAKKDVFTINAGSSLSKMRGDGLDFCEIRPYQFGDDVRKVNFSASSKTGELQTSVFNESKQINVILTVVLNAGLFFGSQKLKITTLVESVAILGFSSIKQKNNSKIIIFKGLKKHIFKLKNEGDLLKILEFILSIDLLKIVENFESISKHLLQEKKALVFILGDFYQFNNYGAIAKKHQLNIIIVRDKLEELPNFCEELSLINSVNNSQVLVNIGNKLAKKYQILLAENDKKLWQEFKKYNVCFGKIFTSDKVFIKLNNILR